MNCQQMSQLMSLSLDDALDDAQSSLLQSHLAECPACQAEWAAMQHVSHLLVSAPMIAPPPGFTLRVSQRLTSHQTRRRELFGGAALVMGSLSLSSLLIPLAAGMIILLWQACTHPSLLSRILHLGTRLAAPLNPLLEAGRLLLTVLSPTPGLLILFGYVVVVLALTLVWLRLTTGLWSRYKLT
jgi:anti-sigma factor RsiW